MGFEPTTYSLPIDWHLFDQYLDSNSYRRDHTYWRNVAKKYYNVLLTGNATQLLTLTQSKRWAAMKALTHLAKFLGLYQQWREIIQRYDLKWSSKHIIPLIEKVDLTNMICYFKDIKPSVSKDIWYTFVFDTLTGLRANECCHAIELLQSTIKVSLFGIPSFFSIDITAIASVGETMIPNNKASKKVNPKRE